MSVNDCLPLCSLDEWMDTVLLMWGCVAWFHHQVALVSVKEEKLKKHVVTGVFYGSRLNMKADLRV